MKFKVKPEFVLNIIIRLYKILMNANVTILNIKIHNKKTVIKIK